MSGELKINGIDSKGALIPIKIYDVNGVEIGQFCRAWIRFNGVSAGITDSFNILSLTDSGVGDYIVTYINNMPNINYSAVGSCAYVSGENGPVSNMPSSQTVSDVSIQVRGYQTANYVDSTNVSLIAHSN